MPYITKERREHLKDLVKEIGKLEDMEVCAGDLNYLFTNLCLSYLISNGECYQAYNDLLGALEGCKLELYRRHVAKYENIKIEQNGDV